ncbi:MAG: hypothetical protein RMK01_09025 [Thermomicrobium sp.]|nr:hypothetical protein [Thermomicrobium sp.]MDW8060203.1 hypothetical protein [Thermomicrobium sp.]
MIAAHVFWVARRFRSFRVLDRAYALLVTWSFAVAFREAIRRGPIWETEFAGSPVWLRSLIALAAAIWSVYVTWWLIRKVNRSDQPEKQSQSARS